jgi:uncharacterized protein (TIGR00290 family)
MRVALAWSSGKDSAWTLHALRLDPRFTVVGLLTTVNAAYDRVAMHAVRRRLLEAQADAAGLPLHVAEIPYPCPNETYEAVMASAVERLRADGVEGIAFGDLFLEDVRRYRERQMAGTGLAPLFPLWGRPTAALAREMVDGGLQARLTCVDPRVLPASFAGKTYDENLLRELPDDVDPCGERGEFHTCVVAGPMFARRIGVTPGEIVRRDVFVFSDLLPTGP